MPAAHPLHRIGSLLALSMLSLLMTHRPADADPKKAHAEGPHRSHGHHGHGHHAHGHAHGSHGNPADLEDYVRRMEDPSRDEWQKPDEVVKALGLKPGATVCEIGPGPGYFTRRLARAVGPAGRVFAADVEPSMLVLLRERLAEAKRSNVTPVLASPDDPNLPAKSCDVVLVVNAYHHFPDGPAYLATLRGLLKPGGRLANVDYHDRETPVGPPVEMRISRETFLADAKKAGFELDREHGFLPHQYFVVLK